MMETYIQRGVIGNRAKVLPGTGHGGLRTSIVPGLRGRSKGSTVDRRYLDSFAQLMQFPCYEKTHGLYTYLTGQDLALM